MQTNDRITIEERNVDGDTQGMMKIKNVQKEDESLYACKAHNKATEITPNAVIPETQSNLDVQSKSGFFFIPFLARALYRSLPQREKPLPLKNYLK